MKKKLVDLTEEEHHDICKKTNMCDVCILEKTCEYHWNFIKAKTALRDSEVEIED